MKNKLVVFCAHVEKFWRRLGWVCFQTKLGAVEAAQGWWKERHQQKTSSLSRLGTGLQSVSSVSNPNTSLCPTYFTTSAIRGQLCGQKARTHRPVQPKMGTYDKNHVINIVHPSQKCFLFVLYPALKCIHSSIFTIIFMNNSKPKKQDFLKPLLSTLN